MSKQHDARIRTARQRPTWLTPLKVLPSASCLLCLTLAADIALADEDNSSMLRDPLDGRFDASEYLAENAFGFLPVPVIITDPAVDGGLGMFGLFFHESEEDAAARKEAMRESEDAGKYLLPPSVSAVGAAYTGNESWLVGGGYLGFFREGKLRYQGGGGYGDVDLDFFGFGELEFDRPISLNTQAFAVVQSLKSRLGNSRAYIGIAQRFVSADLAPSNLGFVDDLPLPPDIVDEIRDRLTQGVTTSALGLQFEYDSRDNFFSPRQGYRYSFDYYAYRDWLGSDIDYDAWTLSGLNYWRLSDKFRLGLRIQADIADASDLLPPFATPSMNLRGIQIGRYQGNYVGVAESEFTWQIDSRWSVLAFAGIGRAANSFDEFQDAENRITRGGGFRYLIARRYGFDMGIDIARGPEDTIWYIQAGSAWGR